MALRKADGHLLQDVLLQVPGRNCYFGLQDCFGIGLSAADRRQNVS